VAKRTTFAKDFGRCKEEAQRELNALRATAAPSYFVPAHEYADLQGPWARLNECPSTSNKKCWAIRYGRSPKTYMQAAF
jgi:hypothetical protein